MELRSVSVWFGTFGSPEAVEDYLDEVWDDEDQLGSAFAEDMGQERVDPALVRSAHRGEASPDPASLLAELPHAELWGPAAAACWEGLELPIDTAIVVFNDAVATPRSVDGDDYGLWFVGSFGERR